MRGWLLLALGGALYTIGDVLAMTWLKEGTRGLAYWSALAVYFVGLFCLLESFRQVHVAAATSAVVTLNLMALAALSATVFDMPMTPRQWTGLAVGAVSVFLLER